MEYVYSVVARSAGLSMADCRLFRGRSGRVYFGTRRFDRPARDRKLHLHSFAGLVHDNFRVPALDYGHLMDAAFRVEQSTQAYQKVLRMAAFNVYTHNRDDHSNNFSFLMDEAGRWALAPAYDLNYSRTAHGEHSLTVAEEGRDPGTADLLRLADHFSVRGGKRIVEEVREAVYRIPTLLREYGVSPAVRREVRRHLNGLS